MCYDRQSRTRTNTRHERASSSSASSCNDKSRPLVAVRLRRLQAGTHAGTHAVVYKNISDRFAHAYARIQTSLSARRRRRSIDALCFSCVFEVLYNRQSAQHRFVDTRRRLRCRLGDFHFCTSRATLAQRKHAVSGGGRGGSPAHNSMIHNRCHQIMCTLCTAAKTCCTALAARSTRSARRGWRAN